ncbi:MAG: hypothetical protein EA420_03000 [Candidatus Competibacteraceae bacterium]|nr:MAG: hypothetical protein EA420_03000 [Candidatus Competibacteraceae bacterium]
MALLPVSPAKLAVVGLAAALAAGVYTLATQPDPPRSPARAKPEEPPHRRGDDPTYAEELKKMAALLQDMRYRFNQSENQREIERQRAGALARTEAQRALQQSRHEMERLNTALREARSALEQKIQAAADAPGVAAVRAEIARLAGEQQALRARLDDPPPAPDPAPDPAARPEANRVLRPPEPRPPAAADGWPLAPPGALTDLDGLADRIARRFGPEGSAAAPRLAPGAGAARAPGFPDAYVTLKPYGGARPPGRDPLRPKPYPFTVKIAPEGVSAVIPVYTIPDAATLVRNSTMTPLIGRVPVRGRLRDPFRFKLITGATNLASNGHRIPGVAHAVWTGYAVGVREQSCVRAYLDTVTFTFADGRLHTVRKGKGQTRSPASVDDNLGYLTDPWGKPCIRGRLFDNAGSYLRARGVAAFLDGLANAYGHAQLTAARADGALETYVSGDTYEYAAARGVAGATGELADHARERALDAFDVVYVPSGIDVQIFVEQEIPIDYDTDGRRLRYHYQGVSHATFD